jgi:hypothetical protein
VIILPDTWENPSLSLSEDEVTLVGIGGSAGSVLGHVTRILKRTGNPREVIDAWHREAMSGDYDHLLHAAQVYLGEELV